MSQRVEPRGRRAILVTGGANGLGAAMVRHFTVSGHAVAIADIDEEAGTKLAEATGCSFILTDVAVFEDNRAAVEATVERFGGLDSVCLNAGVPGGTSTGEGFDPERYRRSIQVNLDGAVYGVNAALPHLRARGRGAVLITSSIAGIAPSIDLYYSAAKHALVGLTRSLALLLRNERITVNAICPGFIDTRIIDGVRETLTANRLSVADPREVAKAAIKILESQGTGQVWEVQAGRQAKLVKFPEVTLSRDRPVKSEFLKFLERGR